MSCRVLQCQQAVSVLPAFSLRLAVFASGFPTARAVDAAAPPARRPVPPIESPRTDLSPKMPPGSPAAVADPPAATGQPPVPVDPPNRPPPAPAEVGRGFVEGQSREVAAERDARTTVFENPDGTKTARLYGRPVRWREASSGPWREFDPAIQTGARLSAPGTPLTPGFGLRADDPALLQVGGESGSAAFSLEGAAPVAGVVDGAKVTYEDALPGADLVYRVFGDRVKEDIVLDAPPAAGPVSYRFPVAVEGLTPKAEENGAIGFYDTKGALRFFIPPGVALDSSGNPTVQSPVSVRLEGKTGSWAVRVVPDAAWLADAARVYPVRVDPAIHFADGAWPQTYDAYAASNCGPCNFNGGAQTDDGWYHYNKIGISGSGAPQHYTYLHYDMGPVMGKQIFSGTWHGDFNYATPNPNNFFSMWRVTEPWQAWEISWNTLKNHDGNVVYGTVPSPYYGEGVRDLTGWVVNWSNGTWANNGISMDSSGQNYYFELAAAENAYTAGNETYIEVSYNSAPSMANPTGPANTSSLHSLTPTLSATASDADGDGVNYYFRLCTGANAESGTCWDSGWQVANSWGVPAGALGWNQTYYWHVYTYDGWAMTSPNWVWSFGTTNSAPPTPSQASPAADAVLVQTNLSFSAGAVADPDNDSVKYQFQVATGPDGQNGRLATSQWLSAPSWTPPAGTFADGGSYTWVVRAQDNLAATSAWSTSRKVKIDFRLGQKATLPYDTVGPAAVNLSNGNLFVSVAGPSYPTVGGPVGVGFSYNSQAPTIRGLTGDYYQDLDSDGIIDQGEPRLLHRIDPQLAFEWGSPGEGPNSAVLNPERWIARWTGAIRVPAGQEGSWVFVTDRTDDSLKVQLSGNLVLQSGITNVAVAGTPVALASTSSTPIQVDYVQATGPQYLRLKIRKASDPNSAAFDIPSDWLTPTQPSLPDGWSRSGDSFTQAAYTALRPVNGTTTAVVDDSGADHLYSSSGSGWKPPANENGVLTQKADGTWSLLDDDGYLYGFSIEGRLSAITSPADDLRRGAPSYTYAAPNAGGPTRLTRITDATSRKIDFTYGPAASCPTSTGFDTTAPADMLCKVTYSDFGGGATELYYSGGHVARLVSYTSDPGPAIPRGDVVDFGYNADGLLTQIRGVLTNDLIAAGAITDGGGDVHKWLVNYDSDALPARRKVTSVKAPVADAAMVDSSRPLRSYIYSPGTGLPNRTDVSVAGANGPQGYARSVVLDADGHATADYDATGIATDTVWDSANNRPTKTIDHHYQPDPVGGLVTTYQYDPAGRRTDTYGPAPAGEFDGQGRSTTAPRSTAAYDEGMNGLAAAWFDNPELANTPKAHSTTTPNVDWGAGSPATAIPTNTTRVDSPVR